MELIVANLTEADMIAIASYVSSRVHPGTSERAKERVTRLDAP